MDTQYKNFKIWNTQLSQKELGKYPIASNPYLELCIARDWLATGVQKMYRTEQCYSNATLMLII